jgi:hypothetical protein
VTRSHVDFIQTSDPLLRQPSLAYQVVLPVLGIDTHFESNSEYVRNLAEETFGAWASLEVRPSATTIPVHVRIIIHDGTEHTDDHAPVRYISTDDTRLIVHSPGSVAIVDASRRESLAYVTTSLAADRDHFRVAVLEAITFALLACFDRHPIHAAAIAQNGRAVLLAGPSGTGKSTLAYLAHTAGIDILSDDRVWIQLEPALQIWGGPTRVRLLEDATTHFPELLDSFAQSRSGAREKIAFATIANGTSSVSSAQSAVVCILARDHKVALERITGSELLEELAKQLALGFDRFPKRHDDVVRTLAGRGGWRLTLSNNPWDALPLLHRMLNES